MTTGSTDTGRPELGGTWHKAEDAPPCADKYPAVLSFAPGGMSEIGLIALTLGLDVGFVATIQVSRLTTIALFAPWAFRRIRHVLTDKPPGN